MTGRLTLICCGATAALRRNAFHRDEPLEQKSLSQAQRLATQIPGADRVWHGPELRVLETANTLGLKGEPFEALADQNFGFWAGRRLAELDPAELAAWMSDPDVAPHGGETLNDLRRRIAAFLKESLGLSGHTLAITHPAVIRAAVCEVLGAPSQAFRAVDVQPLSLTHLTSDGRRWALRMVSG